MRTKLLWPCLAVLALPGAPAPAPAQPPALVHYAAGMEARDAGDYPLYIRELEAALAEMPGHAILMRHLAQGYALAGDPDSAVVWLDRMVDGGAWFDLALYEELAALPDSPGLEAVRERLERIHRPQGTAEMAFRVPDPFLIPEGIAYDPRTGTFYLSSLRSGSIVATAGDGTAREFAGDEAGLYGGLGLEVDEERGQLWAVSAAFAGVEGYTEEMKGFSTLSSFDLESGERLFHLDVSDPGSPHSFADLVLDSSGRVYVTDAMDGGVYRLEPGADELEAFLAPGTVFGPNGITLDEKRGLLYVAQYNLDVVAVDLADGSVHPLGRPDDVVLYGVDGLYLHGDALLAIQNHPSLDRVVRLPLSGDGRSVTGVEILVARHPLFEEPTTGIPVGDRFYFIANSQIEKMARAEDPQPDDFEETVILEVDLGR